MEGFIYDLLETIKKHYKEHKERDQVLEKQLAELSKIINQDLDPEGSKEHYLFFSDLTPDAQMEFLDKHNLEYEDLDQTKAIVTYKLNK